MNKIKYEKRMKELDQIAEEQQLRQQHRHSQLLQRNITESARPGRMQQARKEPLKTMTTPKRALIRTKAIRCSTGTASRFIQRQHSSRTRCALKLRT